MNEPARQAPQDQEDVVKLEGFASKDLYQKREKIFTRFVGGFYQRLRFFTGWPLLLGYFLLPWLNWDGRQAVLFDLPARQFHIFDLTFWPQDLWLLGWLLMIAAFGLFTVTTLVGRLWCGYTCPQTVWTAIFMWIEQVTEGERHQRIRLDKAPWSLEKVLRRVAKHGMWLGMAFLTGLSFVGYFAPIRELAMDFLTLQVAGWSLFWTLFFTAATYANAGWMREQVCIYMCPYARFQSAMYDRDTLIVSYDAGRGEPRGSRKRGSDRSGELGDCIDCQLCVQVCPTGIDIRNGLQYECIGCAHCIDACDQVMNKMGYEPGLVRYTTLNALGGGTSHWLRFRSVGYSVALVVMIIAFLSALVLRTPFAFDVLRERGELYQVTGAGAVRNNYELRIMNKGAEPADFQLSIVQPQGLQIGSTAAFAIPAGSLESRPLTIVGQQSLPSTNQGVILQLCRVRDGRCVSEETRFLGPAS